MGYCERTWTDCLCSSKQVGCGGRGTGAVADAFSTTGGPVRLYAMADLFEQRLQNSLNNLTKGFADKIDMPPERQFVGFDAYKKAIDCLRPDDVVLLTTHAAFRPLHFEYAVNKGMNVFAEKSFATDAPGVRLPVRDCHAAAQDRTLVAVGAQDQTRVLGQELQRVRQVVGAPADLDDGPAGHLAAGGLARGAHGGHCPWQGGKRPVGSGGRRLGLCARPGVVAIGRDEELQRTRRGRGQSGSQDGTGERGKEQMFHRFFHY